MEIKEIEGYEGKYAVDTLGNVYNLNYKGTKKKRLMTQHSHPKGGQCVCLFKYGHQKNTFIHNIVAATFIDTVGKDQKVTHINGNKNDNRVENLQFEKRDNLQKYYRDSAYSKLFGKMQASCFDLIRTAKKQCYPDNMDLYHSTAKFASGCLLRYEIELRKMFIENTSTKSRLILCGECEKEFNKRKLQLKQ